ncbi:hypothetical protein LCGC14_1464410 [marine sediment metagenome]|uniref:Uncharacterized protein n=1 Tax=marine sediment metagenome TaxID=412755 RepID=A0A0F9K046_9ZZZZ
MITRRWKKEWETGEKLVILAIMKQDMEQKSRTVQRHKRRRNHFSLKKRFGYYPTNDWQTTKAGS